MTRSMSVFVWLLAATFAFSLPLFAQSGTGSGESKCKWVWGPEVISTAVTQESLGSLSITKTLKIYYGIESCEVPVYEKVCYPIPEEIVVETCYIQQLPDGTLAEEYFETTEFVPGNRYEYKTEKTGTAEVTTGVVASQICYSFALPFLWFSQMFPASNEGVVSLPNYFTLNHDDVDPIYFDGELFPPGTSISLLEQEVGEHVITYVQPGPSGPEVYTLTLEVTESYPMTQVDSDPGLVTVPSGVFEFTNDTPDVVEVTFVVSTTSQAVTARVSNNRATVAPGATVQRWVEFETVDGYALGDGLPACARVDVHPISVDHPVIASTNVQTCSYSAVRGTQEDLSLESTVNGEDLPRVCSKLATAGDDLTVRLNSPGGGYAGDVAAIYFDLFHPFTGIERALPTVPELHVSAAGLPLAPAAPLPVGGIEYTATLGPAFQGLTLRVQGVVFSSSAANGVVALTDAHDILVY